MSKRKAKHINPYQVQVVSIVAQALLIDEIEVTPKSKVMEDLGADSIDFVEVCMDLEEVFGITLDDEDAGECVTVEDLVELVEAKMAVPA